LPINFHTLTIVQTLVNPETRGLKNRELPDISIEHNRKAPGTYDMCIKFRLVDVMASNGSTAQKHIVDEIIGQLKAFWLAYLGMPNAPQPHYIRPYVESEEADSQPGFPQAHELGLQDHLLEPSRYGLLQRIKVDKQPATIRKEDAAQIFILATQHAVESNRYRRVPLVGPDRMREVWKLGRQFKEYVSTYAEETGLFHESDA
jgi:hypothetical protein